LEFYSYIKDTSIQFEAFLTSYSDSFNSNWNQESVYGRMDPIYTFQNTQRTFSLSFTIPNVVYFKGDQVGPASSMDRLNQFFQFLYPKYSNTGNALTISQAPLVRIKFGNMIARSVSTSIGSAKDLGLLGAITSLSMTPKIEHGFSKRTTPMEQTLIYPNFIDLSLGFNVIHEQDALFSGDFPYGGEAWVAIAAAEEQARAGSVVIPPAEEDELDSWNIANEEWATFSDTNTETPDEEPPVGECWTEVADAWGPNNMRKLPCSDDE
jgi:hypothetical protein